MAPEFRVPPKLWLGTETWPIREIFLVVTTIDTLDELVGCTFECNDESTLTTASAMSRWRETLAPYTEPRVARSACQVLASVAAYLALATLTYFSITISLLLALALAVPTAGFLLRTYIVFHDCAHGSFLPWRRAEQRVRAL